ncbi:MAG: DUF1178 family protein [Parasphingorhabdus sp.]|nr:DUF1178 family protein [Parasphingorhabdus sp.]
MIVFDLLCRDHGHRFEGWFGSAKDYDAQRLGGLLSCPQCGSQAIEKAVMAPNIGAKGNQKSEPTTRAVAMSGKSPLPAEMLTKLAEMQRDYLKSSQWVGSDFPERARAIHYGEVKATAVHGEASPEEAKALIEEGVEIAPLPFPVVPPDKTN